MALGYKSMALLDLEQFDQFVLALEESHSLFQELGNSPATNNNRASSSRSMLDRVTSCLVRACR
eukprot:CAMPEP_0172563224 /NCGR_PEP_ID=MMETSP1067-20121228/100004_1 /TAXON_ID=265564 ORGANISM="Thalassiosira punctigera, Strain Tpunct2005C2" /NCGR_SAMPLE_ID=MMETSP1067 /ASSEMBLY_ACC=CAM_ASM_000444 /LENGTH=63 /DNA_ID=CAMNT_0013353625 /DNA_START=66 /DNA_END=253 /DNA_ORIENTATION=-